ncbi:MAG: IPT/TIG domain-containing protein, partial [Chitinophagaceae bacterium]|nr:IPT/TIG domain-containing protein [Chitinophagaceae bacterium]
MRKCLGSTAFALLFCIVAKAQPVINSFSPDKGPVGSIVTISGTNLAAVDNIVYFGLVKAVINSSTNETLTVTVPAGATQG